MNNHIKIVSDDGVKVFVVINDKLVNYKHFTDTDFTIGSIYRGRHIKDFPGMNLSNIDIGIKTCLPHKERLSNSNRELGLYQLQKLSFDNKLPLVTEKIEIKSDNLIIKRESSGVYISKKILDKKERARLKDIFQKLLSQGNLSIIVRSSASGMSEGDLYNEYLSLLKQFQDIIKQENFLPNPEKVYDNPCYQELLEYYLGQVDYVEIDNKSFNHVCSNYKDINTEELNLLKNELDKYSGRKVIFEDGRSLVIDKLEALTVIDINSGLKNYGYDKESNASFVNQSLIDDILIAIMIQDIKGVVILDPIRTKNSKDFQNKIYDRAKSYMIKINSIYTSPSGLVEMIISR